MDTMVYEKPQSRWKPSPGEMVRRAFVVNVQHGLHARPCALLVKTLQRFRATVEVEADNVQASGQSIMDLMALAAGCGTRLTFTIRGQDAPQAMAAVQHLFATHFAEAYHPPPHEAKALSSYESDH